MGKNAYRNRNWTGVLCSDLGKVKLELNGKKIKTKRILYIDLLLATYVNTGKQKRQILLNGDMKQSSRTTHTCAQNNNNSATKGREDKYAWIRQVIGSSRIQIQIKKKKTTINT
jgi:hypothetical protein